VARALAARERRIDSHPGHAAEFVKNRAKGKVVGGQVESACGRKGLSEQSCRDNERKGKSEKQATHHRRFQVGGDESRIGKTRSPRKGC
jgi:hypothetical protein